MKEQQPETTLPTKANRSTLAGATYVNYEENTVELIDRGVDDTLEGKISHRYHSLPLSLPLSLSFSIVLFLSLCILIVMFCCYVVPVSDITGS